MQRIRLTVYWASLATFVTISVALPLSSLVGCSVGTKKMNPATGLTAVEWEASTVYGLLFVSKYDSTQGTPVAGRYVPEAGVLPALTEFYIQAKPFAVDLRPYLSLAATPYAGSNGMSSVALPLWPAALLSSLYPAVLLFRRASRRWREGGAGRRKVIALSGLTIGAALMAAVACRAVRANRQSAELAGAKTDAFYHEMDLFATYLQSVAWDEGGECRYRTLSDAIGAVRRGSSLYSGDLARTNCPTILLGRDPWGQPIIYEWSDGGRKVWIRSNGPPGLHRPLNVDLEIEKRTF